MHIYHSHPHLTKGAFLLSTLLTRRHSNLRLSPFSQATTHLEPTNYPPGTEKLLPQLGIEREYQS